jgi:hypothetical protein
VDAVLVRKSGSVGIELVSLAAKDTGSYGRLSR